MKKQKQLITILFTGAALALTSSSILTTNSFGQDEEIEKVKIKENGKIKVKGEDGKVKIKPDGEVKIKGDADEELAAARAALTAEQRAEFAAQLSEGYIVPAEQYYYFEEVPATYTTKLEPVQEGYAYRYFDGKTYTVDLSTNTVVAVTTYE